MEKLSVTKRAELPECSLAYIERLEDRIDALEGALQRIRNWCDAYPVDVFTPPTEEEVAASVNAMKAPGCASSDRMHGSWARHILRGVRGYTDV